MPETAMSLSVAANSWLPCALILAIRYYLPGLCWLWLAPGWPDNRPRRFLATQAIALSIGFAFSGLLTFTLGELGLYRPLFEIAALLLFSALGLGLGLRRLGSIKFIPWPYVPIGLVTLFLLNACVMLLPQRGEWIAGGWDPGLYVSEGINLSQTESLQPDQPAWLEKLSEEELTLFTRERYNFTEFHPVIPLRTDERSIERFFFHMTPSVIAMLDRAGGVRAATRVNLFMWAWCILLLAGVLKQMELGSPFTIAALLLFALHPIALYHAHFPTSEFVHTFFIFCIFLWLPLLRLGRRAQLVSGFFFLCAVLNRHTFVAFAPLLLLIHLWAEYRIHQRAAPLSEIMPSMLGMLLGVTLNHFTSPSTLARISDQLPMVYIVSVVFTGGVLGYAALTRTAFVQPLQRLVSKWMLPAILLSVALLLAASWFSSIDQLNEGKNGFRAAWTYLTPGSLGLALIGLIAAYFAGRRLPSRLFGIVWACACITLLSLANLSIANLYPWATRRFLIYTVPLLALCGGIVMHITWTSRRWFLQACGVALVATPLLWNAERSIFVLEHTEFNGLSSALDEMAAHIPVDDFIIADHFRWGTPLYYLHQRNVINGEVFWSVDDATRFQKAIDALNRIKTKEQAIWILTSTEKGLATFPTSPGPTKLITQLEPWTYQEYTHHSKLRDYRVQQKEKLFRLYRLNNTDI